jgi:16S rRNA (uracil1498-N3)-methyltransferase
LIRIYFQHDIPDHGRAELSLEQAHHVGRVLRLKAGDAVTLFDGRGGEYPAKIAGIMKDKVSVDVGDRQSVDREAPIAVTLAQGISSGERMDYTIQKAVELGAVAIQPLSTERSVVRLDPVRAAKRVAHWQAIVIGACEQCGRNTLPSVLPVKAFSSWLQTAPAAAGICLLLTPRAATGLRDLARPVSGVTLLAGPEGGLTPEEQADAERLGFLPLRLGPRVLRTETAAVAALAAMQALWGDL